MLRTRAIATGVAGSPWYYTFHWDNEGSVAAGQAQDATLDWAANMAGATIDEVTLTVADEVIDLDPATGAINAIYAIDGDDFVGGDSSEPLPFQVCMMTRFSTAGIVAGRRVQGRQFYNGFPETYNGSGAGPIAVNREAIEGVYASSLLAAGVAALAVWSPPRPGRAGSVHQVISVSVDPLWHSLRSRSAYS